MKRVLVLLALLIGCQSWAAAQEKTDQAVFASLEAEFSTKILPLIDRHCLECHDAATTEGELDLERFANLAAVRVDPKTWQHLVEQLENGEMPPKKTKDKKDRPQPSDDERATLIGWAKRYLHAEAIAQAGDPGPVVLRRLSNSEYTYTVRDLTGVDSLDPVREFPVDSAAGEGFTNAGAALVMSPALFEKYLEAGKDLAEHAVLLPDGFRFSASTSRADHANEILAEIRALYLQATGGKEINFSYTSQVRGAAPEGEGEGRLDLTPYFTALLANRERLLADPDTTSAVAMEAGLNAPYFGALSRMLGSAEPKKSILLDRLRERWRTARPDQAAALAAEVRNWQDQLWRFNNVGHLGLIRPWQEPVTPLATARDIRVKIEPETRTVYLTAQNFGTGSATVHWQQPRIERPGRPPILVRDLQRGFDALKKVRSAALASTARYLEAVAQVRRDGPEADVKAIAAAHRVEVALLNAWVSHLGLEHRGEVQIGQHLTAQVPRAGAYDFVKGWTLEGVADFSLLGNSSDQNVKIPGDLNAHKIVVHPRPERWIAAGWRSPLEGRVTLNPGIRDAHPACGNGVSWWLELRRGTLTRVLQSGIVELGQSANAKPVENLEVRKGDLLSIVIGARDNNHSCDLTQIDLEIEEIGGQNRGWSLAGDCADNIHAGNPHPDRLGNLEVWHFYGGMNDQRGSRPGVIPGSFLAQWLDEKDSGRAGALAERIQSLLVSPLPDGAAEPDQESYRQLTSFDGPLFSSLDFAALAKDLESERPESFEADGSFPAGASSPVELAVPGALVAGADFVVRGVVHESSDPGAALQMAAGTGAPISTGPQLTNQPIVIRPDGAARKELEAAFADFRALFPAAMCYARVVPADEVVTLLIYHRDDEHLARLMLTPEERARLDKLWDQLLFVSQEPPRLVTSYEQLWQFATQDADPTRFEPMEGLIRKRAAEFAKTLIAAEPKHLDALVAFAPRVYRRPLTDPEQVKLRSLYDVLRQESLTHEEAFRLTLARLFTTAAFLYKTEKPAPGSRQAPVSNWELATRLSYFLTSSAPDAELRKSAAAGALTDSQTLREHTRRLLEDDRARRLAIEFACQWLHIRDFDRHDEKNEKLYPEFVDLRRSMYEEAIRFFTDFFQNDRSVLSLLDADHTFADAPLARFYGLPAPDQGWQRIEDTRKFGRGGLLGFATTLAKQSGASRTSPILRGNWVSETLLGERLPRPPKGVPPLPETLPVGLSERELIARHTSDPACAKCHYRIDPYGFALESYDAIGHRRTGADTTATLPDGVSIDGLEGLRRYLVEDRRSTFVRHFCRKLLGYALGREVQLSDQPLLDDVMTRLEENDYRIGLAVEAIVLSPQFRDIRGADSH